ncbi:hypothetical protein HJC23_002040 [Cyclotella cryptica]|uniref:SWI/SNF-like complex subunit BAF250 C-terminal domain-containing protein n=1 Tax=Cyclotella cryptica TaxID=29204 RepID=A0ABD3Q5R6_9STRA|eukprot:CCRYP_008258-RA/>CCRYP_008258-RA protein AED:0.23 eAED:0.23 QI:0/-1/0/1/-1/1/1/0/599
MNESGGFTEAQPSPSPAQQPEAPPPKRDGRGRPKKRKTEGKEADGAADKKRRPARNPRVPSAPPSIDLVTTHAALGGCDVMVIASNLMSDDPEKVSWALNGLLKATADVESNYCLGVGGEKVISALCQLFDETIGWDEPNEGNEVDDFKNLAPNVSHWRASSLIGKHERWRSFCRDKLASQLASSSDPSLLIDPETDVRVLDMVVIILRNLSYVAQNLRFLAHSESALRVLTGALYYRGYAVGVGGGEAHQGEDVQSSSHQSNMCVYSIQALINMAPLIDVTGRQIFIDRVFLESDEKEITSTVPDQTSTGNDNKEFPTYGIASRLGFGGMHLAKQYDSKAETIDAISDDVVWALVGSHVRTTLAIFPALSSVMDPNDTTTMSGWHRPSVQTALDLFIALLENTDNKAIFLTVPDSLLHQLTEMLYFPRLGPDSMDYIDPVRNVVSRVIGLKFMGYDATVDSDLRDRACELLVKLTELSPITRRRLGMATSISGMAQRDCTAMSTERQEGISPSILQIEASSSPHRINVRLYDSLLSMISTSSGRGDAASLAAQLLSNLVTVPENKAGILYVERKLISVSAKDPHVANVACNSIFNRLK